MAIDDEKIKKVNVPISNDWRLDEPQPVKECWEQGLLQIYSACLASNISKCRYQGKIIMINGCNYYECTIRRG